MKITPLTTKEIRQFTEKQMKIRINVNMLVQQICRLREETSEEKKFKLENDELFYELECRKKDEIMAQQRFDRELPKFTSTFYKKKLKECSDAAQVKELLHQMSVG